MVAVATERPSSLPRVTPRQLRLRRLPLYVGLVIISVLWLAPIGSQVNTAFKSQAETYATPAWQLPHRPTFDNFDRAWAKIEPQFINTFIITIPSTLLSVGIGALAAYSISRLKFVGSNLLYLAIVGSFVIPFGSIVPTLVNMLDQFGLYDTFAGIILTHTAHGQMIMVFMLARFFKGIPDEVVDAARVDGCSALGVLWNIVLPLSTPALAAGVILQFAWIWNDFFKALIIVPTTAFAPVTVALQGFTGQYATEVGYRSAASLIAALPSLIVFVIFQRFFVRGITSGALKG
jgi:ABC-type glycerol-3-phosphate transport system permease component